MKYINGLSVNRKKSSIPVIYRLRLTGRETLLYTNILGYYYIIEYRPYFWKFGCYILKYKRLFFGYLNIIFYNTDVFGIFGYDVFEIFGYCVLR